MRSVQRSVRQKVVGVAAVAVLLGGCAFAAVSATGRRDSGHPAKHALHSAHHLRTRDLAAAASYLRVPAAQLSGELASGKSLAQIVAAQGSGKTAAALVEAIVASRKARLAKTAASLPARVGAEVQRPGGVRSKRRTEHLQKRINELVERKFARGASS